MEEESNNVIVASFPKSNREAICVGVSEYKGKTYVFVRSFVPTLGTDELSPTPAGISLAVEKCGELLEGVKALGDVMGPEKVVARIQKNSKSEIWVGKNVYKEHSLIFIRTYAAYGDQSEPGPTKKGVSMSVELYPQLLAAVEKLAEAVATLEKSQGG